jgi:2'-5' RNA ligase
LQFTSLITLPERGPARLIAAQTDAHPTLMEMHRRLVTRLARNPRERTDERFRPHLTLCRFRSPVSRLRVNRELSLPGFPVAAVKLMRSTLEHSGAQHHQIEAFALIGRGAHP